MAFSSSGPNPYQKPTTRGDSILAVSTWRAVDRQLLGLSSQPLTYAIVTTARNVPLLRVVRMPESRISVCAHLSLCAAFRLSPALAAGPWGRPGLLFVHHQARRNQPPDPPVSSDCGPVILVEVEPEKRGCRQVELSTVRQLRGCKRPGRLVADNHEQP